MPRLDDDAETVSIRVLMPRPMRDLLNTYAGSLDMAVGELVRDLIDRELDRSDSSCPRCAGSGGTVEVWDDGSIVTVPCDRCGGAKPRR